MDGGYRLLKSDDADFTETHYREVLQLVKATNRIAVSFDRIPWQGRYLLWRHDIDVSVNRSLRIATIDAENSIHSTFFVNIHSIFYNPFELTQVRLLREIAEMGHDIGVHFDGAFYTEANKEDFDKFIAWEANILNDLVGKTPVAVSFHSPTERTLALDSPRLGGLVNAYSRRLMADSKYCSDSNGYWRHDRLADVVADETIERLQVLTHPEWWLERPAQPYQRIYRACYGRAAANMDTYTKTLAFFGRQNLGGWDDYFGPELGVDFDIPPFWRQLLSEGRFDLFFLELWRTLLVLVDSVAKGGLRQLSRNQPKPDAMFENAMVASALRLAFLEEFSEAWGEGDKNFNPSWERLGELAQELIEGHGPVIKEELFSMSSTALSLLNRLYGLCLRSGLPANEHPALLSAIDSDIERNSFERSVVRWELSHGAPLHDSKKWTSIAKSLDLL